MWHSSLTEDDSNNLERVQKTAIKIISRLNYKGYLHSLNILDLPTLSDRRHYLCTKFALKNVKNDKMQQFFVKNDKTHNMNTRFPETFVTQYAHTERLRNSPIIYMQRLLNGKGAI